jgi:hypothetical protein
VRLHAAATIAPALLAFLLASPARAADPTPPAAAAAGGGILLALGYIPQAVAASQSQTDGSTAGYIPIAGALKLMTQFIRMDCSRALEGYCDMARVTVPFLLGIDLAFEMAGLGLLTYSAGLAARRRAHASQARPAWVPFVSVKPSAALAGISARF